MACEWCGSKVKLRNTEGGRYCGLESCRRSRTRAAATTETAYSLGRIARKESKSASDSPWSDSCQGHTYVLHKAAWLAGFDGKPFSSIIK